MKQNKSNPDIEYRDQGLTRPKILILVPYRKFALKIIKIIISLLMRKNEEFVSNKKRFFDSFGPVGDEDKEKKENENDAEKDESAEKNFIMMKIMIFFFREILMIILKLVYPWPKNL